MERREFNKMLALGLAAGLSLPTLTRGARAANFDYDVPRFGNVHLMHMTDAHRNCSRSSTASRKSILVFTVHETVLHT